jgi:hypothetical protein
MDLEPRNSVIFYIRFYSICGERYAWESVTIFPQLPDEVVSAAVRQFDVTNQEIKMLLLRTP